MTNPEPPATPAPPPPRGSKEPLRDPWTKENYLAAAATSGKPMEVRCAIEFMKANWVVLLGTYFHDIVTEVPRELDLLAERTEIAELPNGLKLGCIVQALISCKGFQKDRERPVTYSLADSSALNLPQPNVLSYLTPDRYGVGERAGIRMTHEYLKAHRRILAFDVYESKDGALRSKGDRQTKGGDESVYPALDSALKAAVYWNGLQFEKKAMVPTLQLPVLILREPWVDIPLEGGKPGEPTLCDRGYTVGVYPFAGSEELPERVLSLIWAESALPDLIATLSNLAQWFAKIVKFSHQPVDASKDPS